MQRQKVFDDIQKLVNITIEYMFLNNFKELDGGYRNKNSHFVRIAEIFLNDKGCDHLRLAAMNLYVKWNRNDSLFKTNVLNGLNAKKTNLSFLNKSMCSNSQDIYFNYDDWRNLIKTIGNGARKKFTTYANEIIAPKIQSNGINCFYKIQQNYFSTSMNSNRFFWNGVLCCIECQNTISASIKSKPMNEEGFILVLKGNPNICLNQVQFSKFKRNLQGKERESIQKDAYSKGATNFRSEANFFGNF